MSRCTLDQCSDLLVNIIWKVYNKSFLISDSKNWLSLWNGRTVLFPYHTCDIYNRKEMVSVNHLFPVPPYFKEYIPCRERLYICPSRQPSSRQENLRFSASVPFWPVAHGNQSIFSFILQSVSYTHLTLPTTERV